MLRKESLILKSLELGFERSNCLDPGAGGPYTTVVFLYGSATPVSEIAGGFGETMVRLRFGDIGINAGFRCSDEKHEKDKCSRDDQR